MARLTILLLLATTCAGVARPAAAATPSRGAVSAAAPMVRWTGSVTDPLGTTHSAAAASGSTADVCPPQGPACDEYTLEVTGDDAARLTVTVAAEAQGDSVGLSVTTPGGDEQTDFDGEPTASLTVVNARAGFYVVRVLGDPSEPRDVAYAGHAKLEPPPPPPQAPAPPPPPAPQDPAAPADPPPPSSGAPPPEEPVRAGRRELAVEVDRRRVAAAVRRGFRARIVCRGGCDTVRLEIFVSSLTARIYRLAETKGDVRVGGANLLRDAEGRRTVRIRFRRSFRAKLARARNLKLAVEAVARDPDGRVRRVTKRFLLRR